MSSSTSEFGITKQAMVAAGAPEHTLTQAMNLGFDLKTLLELAVKYGPIVWTILEQLLKIVPKQPDTQPPTLP